MRTVYIDPYGGLAGDMLLGALVDAGLDADALREVLARLPVEGYEIRVAREDRMGLAAARLEVVLSSDLEARPSAGSGSDENLEPKEDSHNHDHSHDESHSHGHDHSHHHGHDHDHGHGQHHHGAGGEGEHVHRGLTDIVAMIEAADLPGDAAEWATRVFRRLAEAEAKVHGKTPEEVHFHEVGAVDSIVDIVGVCAGLAMLGARRVEAGPPPMGSGEVEIAHGRLPVPVPAVVELMKGLPTRVTEETGELTTPTGAAILAALAERVGPMPPMTVEAIGYGAGKRRGERTPNLTRVVLGEVAEAEGQGGETVWLLETNVDDATGETLGAAVEELLAAGALDAWLTPVIMKKGRPGSVLSALAAADRLGAVEAAMFAATPTFGVRRRRLERTALAREHVEVDTPFGAVRVKLGRRAGRVITASPEYEDCRARAEAAGVSVREVLEAARAAARQRRARPT